MARRAAPATLKPWVNASLRPVQGAERRGESLVPASPCARRVSRRDAMRKFLLAALAVATALPATAVSAQGYGYGYGSGYGNGYAYGNGYGRDNRRARE